MNRREIVKKYHFRMSSLLRIFLGMSVWKRVIITVGLIWAILAFMSKCQLGSSSNSVNSETENTYRRISEAINYLEETKLKQDELKTLIDEYLGDSNSYHTDDKRRLLEQLETRYDVSTRGGHINEPTIEYQKLLRRVKTNVGEFWNFVGHELEAVKKKLPPHTSPELLKDIDHILDLGAQHKYSLTNDLDDLQKNDNYESWRQKESKDLSDLVQRRLQYLQNPEDCGNARKLVCRLNKGCGYGCQLHHVVYCFIMAYATERTLILKSKGWRYHKSGWEEVFKPISESCTDSSGTSHSSWPGTSNTQVLTLPIVDSLNPRPPFLPLAIPADLAPRLLRLHGDPIVWWVGQFLKYLLKPQPETQAMLDDGVERMGFKKPIVGVHVRRTDKVGTEAAFHGIEEYMKAVDEYYDQREMVETIDKRRVFLASDDPKVIAEARSKYPNYEIIGDQIVARGAAVSTRYTDSSLNGIILDIHLLSLSDYLVCTFSSQVCRIAYEIMQSMYPDASDRFRSLDDIYYYGGQNAHHRQVVLPHKPRNHDEMLMKAGDLVGVAGNHWNGFSKGKNVRTNMVALFPSFKVVDKVETAEFPTYPNVK